MALRKDLDGLRVQLPGNPAIYLIDAGQKRWVPDPPTYDNLFRNWDGIIQDTHIDDIDNGPQISAGAVLARGFGDAAVYLIDNGQKRWIVSPDTMERYQLNWDAVKEVPPILLAFIPNGPQIGWPE